MYKNKLKPWTEVFDSIYIYIYKLDHILNFLEQFWALNLSQFKRKF